MPDTVTFKLVIPNEVILNQPEKALQIFSIHLFDKRSQLLAPDTKSQPGNSEGCRRVWADSRPDCSG